ncbi:hypothetical protein HDU98_007756 [Podochytrium sp. JEL0797]|nr:hypothetical protein HDU98_007756 [Podochytrium sp. JEL0797]
MGPKKSAKKDKKAKPAASSESLDSLDKLTKTSLEIDTLLSELAHRDTLSARLHSQHDLATHKISLLESELQQKDVDGHEITSDMSRQYKSMQSEMAARIDALEATVKELKDKLAMSQTANQESTKEYLRIIAIKDEVIEEQNVKMSYMSAEFESMLNETLQKMSRKLEVVSTRWKENDNMQISEGNSRKLADFHLTRLIHKQDQ